MFVVRAYSHHMNIFIAEFPTHGEAIEFAGSLNWEYIDENEFVWDLDIEEE